MTPMEAAKADYSREVDHFCRSHECGLAAAIAAYISALPEDEETVERVARGQMLFRFGVESIVMFEPPKEATAEQRLILADRVRQARMEARAALLALAKDK